MRGKEGAGPSSDASGPMEVLRDGLRDCQPVMRARTPAKFIKDHQASRGGMAQDLRCLNHLDHEGAAAGNQIIMRPDTRKDSIDKADTRR